MRYRLIAFVCDHNCVKWVNNVGTLEYGSVLSQRPEDCRFAIMQLDNKYLCADLFATQMNPDTLEIYPPDMLKFDSVDAAIMAAQLKL